MRKIISSQSKTNSKSNTNSTKVSNRKAAKKDSYVNPAGGYKHRAH